MKYKKALEFGYTHDYFQQGHMPALFTMLPLAQSSALIADLGLIFKQTDAGFYLAARCAVANENDYFISPAKGSVISVALYANDPYFLNYTDLQYITPGKQLFYNTPLSIPASDLTNNLTAVAVRPKGLLVNKNTFKVTSKLNGADGIVSKCGKKGNPLYPNPDLYYLDMSHWPEGVYEVTGGEGQFIGKKSENFNGCFAFVGRDLMANPPMAILTFNLPDALASFETAYTLTFTARSVIWRYQFLSESLKGNTVDATLMPTNPESPQELSEFIVKNKDNESIPPKDKIKLTQAPRLDIELKDNSDDSVLIANLPNPQLENIYPDENGENFYALIPVRIAMPPSAQITITR